VVSFVECDVRAASLYAPDTLPIMLGALAFMPGSISEEMGPRLPHRELAVQRLTPSYRIKLARVCEPADDIAAVSEESACNCAGSLAHARRNGGAPSVSHHLGRTP
jgi:hypothetical protein